jgi:L-alanine-DL-glutamate epimerase-like enolase superfamily enzyme
MKSGNSVFGLPGMAVPHNGKMKPSEDPGFGLEITKREIQNFKY